MQTWQDKFYELAEIYLESEALIKYACNRLLNSREELQKFFVLETDPRKREAFKDEAIKVVARIRDNQEDPAIEDKKKSDAIDKKMAIKKKQRERLKKVMPVREVIDDVLGF